MKQLSSLIKILPALLLTAFLTGCASNSCSTRSLSFFWNASDGATGYKFYRDGNCVGGSTGTNFNSTISNGDSVWVTATNATEESLPSNVLNF
jgi:hypothetical protein